MQRSRKMASARSLDACAPSSTGPRAWPATPSASVAQASGVGVVEASRAIARRHGEQLRGALLGLAAVGRRVARPPSRARAGPGCGSPASSARSRQRAWKYWPRMVLTRPRPTEARPADVDAGQVLGAGSAARRARGSRGRAGGPARGGRGRRRARPAAVSGMLHADGVEHAARSVASPSSMWPMRRSCSAARRRRSSASPAARHRRGREVGVGGLGARGRRWRARRRACARRARALLALARLELERELVEARGAVEGERASAAGRRPASRRSRPSRGRRRRASARRAPRGPPSCEASSASASRACAARSVVGVEAEQHRLAHPVVVGLDGVGAARAARCARRFAGAQHGDAAARARPSRSSARAAAVSCASGAPATAQQLEEPARARVEPRDARAQRVVEAERAGLLAERAAVAHQLVDEERVAAGLGGDGLGAHRGARARVAQERVDQRARVVRRERLDAGGGARRPRRAGAISSTVRSGAASPRDRARSRARRAASSRAAARGAPGGRMTSASSARLSASAHWRSSMASTSGRRAARRAKSSRSAAKRRARSSSGSSAPGAGRGAWATASTRRSTGKTWPTRPRCRGRTSAQLARRGACVR